ncbi:hypothetical protein [Streptacidiphilus sp. EB129]|uniref:hypothetical protein n=1 Tax=Streptacidiphilus sp. EB129 TaxID=3156262 RepID=UPI003517C9BD
MAVERESVGTLMEWFADGGPVRSAVTGADTLVEKLAAVVFQGEWDWPGRADRIDAYRDGLGEWFAYDSGREQQFMELTSPNTDPGVFVAWFLPVVLEWEGRTARNGTDGTAEGQEATGWPNPNHDGTPDTEFYRLDAAGREYLYSATADGLDWATYEQRRYSEPVRHDEYGLDYRYDRRDEAYEWYDEASGTWNDQAWADLQVAGTSSVAASSGGREAEWDEAWAMFYRVGPGGVYEFSGAVVPGQPASGCDDAWISHAQVLARRTAFEPDPVEPDPVEPDPVEPDPVEPDPVEPGGVEAGTGRPDVFERDAEVRDPAAVADVRKSIESLIDQDPALREFLDDEDIETIIADLSGGRRE